jgi:hypothetical protein
MLNLITGLPGAGKTLYFLSKVLPQYRGRDVYCYGIPALDHDHFGTRDLEKPEEWYDLSEGAVIVIDEAQKIFPVRSAGSKVPRKCAEFETHRHKGFDVVLLTQDGTTLDVHVRKLAGKHLHVHRLFGGHSANIYEYGNFEGKPTNGNVRKQALGIRSWRYDKTIFDHYKSADLHTVKRKIPFKLLVIPVLLALAIVAGYFAVTTVKKLFSNEVFAGGTEAALVEGSTSEAVTAQTLLSDYVTLHTPVIEGMPWTAPVYQNAMRVVAGPKPHCILHEDTSGGDWKQLCTCYTQQMTRMTDVEHSVCKHLAVNGWFDASKDDRSDRGRDRAEREQAPADSVHDRRNVFSR